MQPTHQDEAPPSPKAGSWTLDTLHLYSASSLTDFKNRVSDAFASRDRATELNRQTMLEQIRTTAQDVKEKFANTNEWRALVNDMLGRKADREALEGLLARIERLESAKNQRIESRHEGASTWSLVFAAIGAVGVIVGFLVAVMAYMKR